MIYVELIMEVFSELVQNLEGLLMTYDLTSIIYHVCNSYTVMSDRIENLWKCWLKLTVCV